MRHRYKYIFIATILIISVLFNFCSFAFAKEWTYTTPQEYMDAHKNYVENGQIENARNIMAEMLEKYPNNSDALYYKSGILYYDKQYEEAEKYLIKCIQNDENYSNAYRYLGAISNMKGNNEKAEDYYRKGIAVDPKSPIHIDLAALYAHQEKFTLAEKESELYFEYVKNPSQYSYIVSAYIHKALGKDEKVIEDCQKGLKVDGADPRNVDLLLTLGKTYEKLGRDKEALDTYNFAYSWHKTIKEFKDGIDRVTQKLKSNEAKNK